MGLTRTRQSKVSGLWFLVAASLILASPAHGVILREETVTATWVGCCSPLVTPIVQGGTDQTYLLFIATRSNDDVTSVTGGGLVWTEQIEQCAGREQQGIRLWAAEGSPGAAFTVTVNYNDDPDHPIVAILSRYSGVGSLQDATGENSNGEFGACAHGIDSTATQLTLSSTDNDSVHVIGLNHRNEDVLSYSPGYSQTAMDQDGSDGDETQMTTYERTFNPAATDQFQATIDNDDDWCVAGIVLSPGPSTTVNYRSIGTAASPVYDVGDATTTFGSNVVTFGGGASLPASVGPGDKLVITGGNTIVQEEFKGGGSPTSPASVPVIQGGTNQTYVMFIASRDNADVTSVTGGGLSWTERLEQCGDNSETGTRIWTAQGSPSAFAAQVNYTHSGGNSPLAAVLIRYSGVASFEDPTGENINGEFGSCADATDTTTAQVTLTSTADGSVHLAGVAPRDAVVSSFSSGYALVTSATIGSGPNETRQSVYARSFDPAATDTFQATLSATKDWAAGGIVLNPNPLSTTLYILSRNSTTEVTTQETAANNRTGSYTIDRAYSALQDWEDAHDEDLVGENRREVGVCFNDGPFPGRISFNDSTTDADHYMTLTVAANQRHNGTAGTGARMDGGGGYSARPIDVKDAYTRIEWIEVTNWLDDHSGIYFDESPADDNADGSSVSNVLLHNFFTGNSDAAIMIRADNVTVRNAVIYDGDGEGIRVQLGTGAVIENCTVHGILGEGVRQISGTSATFRNTISTASSNSDFFLEGTVDYFDYNMYGSTSGGFATGANDQLAPLDPDDLFISSSPGLENLHLEASGHNAGNRGLALTAAFTDDIDGQVRTGSWDIGADEAIPGTLSTKPKIISWREVEP
jgi:hypothetical protein